MLRYQLSCSVFFVVVVIQNTTDLVIITSRNLLAHSFGGPISRCGNLAGVFLLHHLVVEESREKSVLNSLFYNCAIS